LLSAGGQRARDEHQQEEGLFHEKRFTHGNLRLFRQPAVSDVRGL
jgi:hypothetical protein